MATNIEWLASLSDRQLAEEIKYGRILVDGMSRHREFNKQELAEAEAEMRRRNGMREE